jgi:hypothetical protein
VKALDPRLRRLVSSLGSQEGVALRQHDLTQFKIVAALPTVGELEPDDLYKRALVLLNQDYVPQELADLRWVQVAHRTWSVNVPLTRLKELGSHPAVKFAEAGRPVAPSLNTSRGEARADIVQEPPPPRRW